MQRIMIVSDTHRRITNLAEALYREGNIDKLIHLGDFEGEDEVIRGMAGCEVMFREIMTFFRHMTKRLRHRSENIKCCLHMGTIIMFRLICRQ